MNQEEIATLATTLAKQQKQLLEVLEGKEKKRKDIWDKLSSISPMISGILIALIGAIFTFNYNSLQSQRTAEMENQRLEMYRMETMAKFVPFLSDEREDPKKVSLLVLKVLGQKELAMMITDLYKTEGTIAAGDIIMASAVTEDQSKMPEVTTVKIGSETPKYKEGWVYLGNYDEGTGQWTKQYCEFPITAQPKTLENKKLSVLDETGALNVREEMPNTSARFGRVIAVLKPGSSIEIKKVKSWLSTGCTWARILYQVGQ